MWAAQPQAPLAEIQAANRRPRGHLSKDQRAQAPLLENTTKEIRCTWELAKFRAGQGGKDQSEALRKSSLW